MKLFFIVSLCLSFSLETFACTREEANAQVKKAVSDYLKINYNVATFQLSKSPYFVTGGLVGLGIDERKMIASYSINHQGKLLTGEVAIHLGTCEATVSNPVSTVKVNVWDN